MARPRRFRQADGALTAQSTSRPIAAWFRLPASALLLWACCLHSGAAAEFPGLALDDTSQSVAGVSVLVGLVLFSTITALLHLAGRNRWTQRENAFAAELTMCAPLSTAPTSSSPRAPGRRVLESATSEPEIEGDLALVTDARIAAGARLRRLAAGGGGAGTSKIASSACQPRRNLPSGAPELRPAAISKPRERRSAAAP